MNSGRKTLHAIDSAINTARKNAGQAARIPAKASQDLINLRREQAEAYSRVAKQRLDLIEEGHGGALGYVDRNAEKLLEAHDAEEARLSDKITESLGHIETLEAKRREQETVVSKAVDAYDRRAAAAEAKILNDPAYEQQLGRVEIAESTLIRAQEKLELAKDEVEGKGAPYRADPFFAYLQARGYGGSKAKGWALTKALDHWVAGLTGYRKSAENYRRLTAIPARLSAHFQRLESQAEAEQNKLQILEDEILIKEGVSALREESLAAQRVLDGLDTEIEAAEKDLDIVRTEHLKVSSGDSGPYRQAAELLITTISRKDLPSLQRLAAQTQSRDDDNAVEDLRRLRGLIQDAEDDHAEAKSELSKYQTSLRDLEGVRAAFKKHRFDAPSSEFKNANAISKGLARVVAGALRGDDLWRQIRRAQCTVKRYSDTDFGGGDWTEGLRLPRSSGRRRRSHSGFPSGGGWGGSAPRRRTSIPRTPRQSLPKSRAPRGRSSGGFRTGGGF